MKSTKINQNFSKKELANLVRGIRKSFNLSQVELANMLRLSRYSCLRYENMQDFPRIKTLQKILAYATETKLSLFDLQEVGKLFQDGYSKDMRAPKLQLKASVDLAELLGIILGDGEILKDGTIRIAFDPKKDKNFLYRRVFYLVKKLLGCRVAFESYKRIAFYKSSFVRLLIEDYGLNTGSKSRSNINIPKWCLENPEYCKAVLRGLFDTDGYFGYWNGHVEVMFGRFTDKCTNLVGNITYGLESLEFKPIVKHTKDGRYRIRITNKKDVLKFFIIIGTSNLKHIVRFLLWRIAGYEAKIEKEGLPKLISLTNRLTDSDIRKISVPYFWINKHKITWSNYIEDDMKFIKTHIAKTKTI